jgi:hypothetical protein
MKIPRQFGGALCRFQLSPSAKNVLHQQAATSSLHTVLDTVSSTGSDASGTGTQWVQCAAVAHSQAGRDF